MKSISSMKTGPKKGLAVLLGDEVHSVADYSKSGGRVVLKNIRTIGSSALRELSHKSGMMSLCFSSRGIYSDVGEFSCVSNEATTAHIHSSVDRLGLFKDDYQVSFTRIQDIDNLKSRYSYLAIPSSELSKISLIDEDEALVSMFCPIEASIAAAVGSLDSNMAVIVFEDSSYVRIIGAKSGIIHYLITVNYAESFDAQSDTVSGIREMISMLQSSTHEKIQKIYRLGHGEIDLSGLEKFDIHTEPFSIDDTCGADPTAVVLHGTVMGTCYDFTPEKLHQTRRNVGYAKVSYAISSVMLVIAVLFFALAWSNNTTARDLEKKTNSEIYKSSRQLKELEDDYTSLSRNLDLTNINSIIDTYKNFQAEPKLHDVVQKITRDVPANVFITKIEINRASQGEDASQSGEEQAGVEQSAAERPRSSRASAFGVEVEGVINLGYPSSKEVFSSFIITMQKAFTVSKASYAHKEQFAEFSLDCEIRP